MAVYKRKRTLPDGTIKTYAHYWYRFVRSGVLIVRNTKQSNRQVAAELENEHRTRLAKGEAGLRTEAAPLFKDFSTRFIDAIKIRSADKPRTVEFYVGRLKSLLAFEPLANARLDRIDEGLIEKYTQHRAPCVSRATLNRDLATCRRVLRLAQEWRIVDRVPRIRLLSGEHQREYVVSRELEPRYLEACPQPLKDLALLILDTGLRAGEALNLEWKDVHLEPGPKMKFGFLQVRTGKSKRARRAIPLTARAVNLLRTKFTAAVDRYVFSNGARPYTVGYVDHMHQEVRGRLGLSAEFVIHGLRHSYGTRLGESGADVFTIMRLMGHSSIVVSQRYVHPSNQAVEAAVERLERSWNGYQVETKTANDEQENDDKSLIRK